MNSRTLTCHKETPAGKGGYGPHTGHTSAGSEGECRTAQACCVGVDLKAADL